MSTTCCPSELRKVIMVLLYSLIIAGRTWCTSGCSVSVVEFHLSGSRDTIRRPDMKQHCTLVLASTPVRRSKQHIQRRVNQEEQFSSLPCKSPTKERFVVSTTADTLLPAAGTLTWIYQRHAMLMASSCSRMDP